MTQSPWTVLDRYFETEDFVSAHHIASYNHFVTHQMRRTVSLLNPFVTLKGSDRKAEVWIGGQDGSKLYTVSPTLNGRPMHPNEARLLNATYSFGLLADITVRYTHRDVVTEQTFPSCEIGRIPIMLHGAGCVLSGVNGAELARMGECVNDQGGYFVVDGKEKVVVAQERLAANRLFVDKGSAVDWFTFSATIRCVSSANVFPKALRFFVVNPVRNSAIEKQMGHKDAGGRRDSVDEDPVGVVAAETATRSTRFPGSIVVKVPLKSPGKGGPAHRDDALVELPLFVLFRALGVESDASILRCIAGTTDLTSRESSAVVTFLYPSLIHASTLDVYSQANAFEFLRTRVEYQRVEIVHDVLMNEVLPNAGTFHEKAVYLGYLTRSLMDVCVGDQPLPDRDNYINKRVDVSGALVSRLFQTYYNQFRIEAMSQIDRIILYGSKRTDTASLSGVVNATNLALIFKSDFITTGFRDSFKGQWGRKVDAVQDADDIKHEVVQDVSRLSYLGFISHLRRVSAPLDPTSKIVEPHRLHSSSYGMMCPCESPDGQSVGLLKNMAMTCFVTFDDTSLELAAILGRNGVVPIGSMGFGEQEARVKVFVDYTLVGIHPAPDGLFRFLKLMKRNALISIYTSVAWDVLRNELQIHTDSGRCVRPLLVVRDGSVVLGNGVRSHWFVMTHGTMDRAKMRDRVFNVEDVEELERTQAHVEYLDVSEHNCSLVHMYMGDVESRPPDGRAGSVYTYCELHPSTMFSVVTANIPLCQHNQAPRNIFFGSQAKQAVGMYATNFNNRIDTLAYILHHPQRSLVTTRYKGYLGCDAMPAGENCVVAIASYTGYNQEDSIIVNSDSLDRGMFNTTAFKSIVVEEQVADDKSGDRVVFGNPIQMTLGDVDVGGIKFAYFKKLDANGFPRLNEYIAEDDAVLGMCKVTLASGMRRDDVEGQTAFFHDSEEKVHSDSSMIADKLLSGVVDKVVVFAAPANPDIRTCKIRLRKFKIPELGDKLGSSHGQKGVCGCIMPARDMPFTANGLRPDIIINPHALPSRMTVAQLIECVLAKVSTCKGQIIDGTPFCEQDYGGLFEELETNYGLEHTGNELMYSGFTGEQLACDIFIGPTYYMRFKHMVSDKINARSTGPMTSMTRQPTQGRGNLGGGRIGEMERDVLLAHGVACFTKEAMMERSDKYTYQVDSPGGDIAVYNKQRGIHRPFEGHGIAPSECFTVETPFAFKLLIQELAATGIALRLNVGDDEEGMADRDD